MSFENGFRIIALPTGRKSEEDILAEIQGEVGSKGNNAAWASVAPFPIPQLKMGSLDSLISLNEELVRLDGACSGLVAKTVDTLKMLCDDDLGKVGQHLQVPFRDDEVPYPKYLLQWEWNRRKYRADKSMRELFEQFGKECHQLDNLFKNKSNAYSSAKTTSQNFDRKKTGNLTTRDLADVVHKDDFVLESEYLETVLVVVPKTLLKTWQTSYERLSPMVVPRSSRQLVQESDFTLFAVVIFQRIHDEFCKNARDAKYTVREFKWDDSALEKQKEEADQAREAERESWTDLLRLTRTTFGDGFALWTHVKAIRIYTESILRFGLPPDFASLVVRVPIPPSGKGSGDGGNDPQSHQFSSTVSTSKSGKRLTKVLQTLYQDLDSTYNAGKTNEVTHSEYASLLGSEGELYSWVEFGLPDPLDRRGWS